MLNHALALAGDGAEVWLAGYSETPLERAVLDHPRIRVCRIAAIGRAKEGTSRFRFLLTSGVRAVFLWFQVLWLLLARTPRGGALLVQNPPSLPTLPVGWLAARLRGSLFIVDWHNFGYAMLALRLGPKHFAVQMTKACERLFGRKADAHFCVSMAMRDILVSEFGVPAPIALYDRPRELLPLVPISSRSAFAGGVLARAGFVFPAGAVLAVCPTSWTADEDMDLLLEGLRQWDSTPAISPGLRLLVLITGRGPLREAFERRLSGVHWQRVEVRTAFLDPAGYRELLCAAHFGFCMHRSSSGVDLPMKVMDLFGARTPVCAFDYGACLAEQLQPGFTGLTFQTSQELALRIDELLHGFPGEMDVLERLQQGIVASCTQTWEQVWQREAAPAFRPISRDTSGNIGAGKS
jgi:beta-1,4-mannosyltransferase